LEVHHIYSYDKHKELRFEVDNGITISKDIHKLFHSIYGYGNNTKEQWEEFVKNFK
jgi:CobQ-like glutamine amidotransferase family enzyme